MARMVDLAFRPELFLPGSSKLPDDSRPGAGSHESTGAKINGESKVRKGCEPR
jgi:hypothetical protein